MTLDRTLTVELINQPSSWIDRGPTPETGHWRWRGPLIGDSPTVYINRSRVSVRRLFFEIAQRPLMRSEKVTMTCSSHRCVRPSHMDVR